MSTCIYCAKQPGTTRDHIPPRGVFPEPRSSDLITVPACADCHDGFKLDDEYFIQRLMLRRDVGTDSRADSLLEKIQRAWQRLEGRGLTDDLVQSLGMIELRSQTGLTVGRAPAYHVDLVRVRRTLSRCVRALFWHDVGERLPNEVEVHVEPWEELAPEDQEEYRRIIRGAEVRAIGDRLFQYVRVTATDEPYATMWVLEFWGVADFIALTRPDRLSRRPV